MASKRAERDELIAEIKQTLTDVWKQGGRAAVEEMCRDSPAKFVQTCAALIPKEVAVMIGSPYDGCRDRQELIDRLLSNVGAESISDAMREEALRELERSCKTMRMIAGAVEPESVRRPLRRA